MLNRRDILRSTAMLGAAGPMAGGVTDAAARPLPGGSMLDLPARDAPVDTIVDHTSILRFLAWRFLGAPAEGRGRRPGDWPLTRRLRRARNIGWSLRADAPDPEFDVTAGADPETSPPCGSTVATAASRALPPPHDLARGLERGYFERLGYEIGRWAPGR